MNTRPHRMSTIERIFADDFASWKIRLPAGAAKRGEGEIRKDGWWIRYVFGCLDGAKYVDYYAMHRMTNDSHVRILESGDVHGLPAMLDMFSSDSSPQSREQAQREFQEHNRRVGEEINKKFGHIQGER